VRCYQMGMAKSNQIVGVLGSWATHLSIAVASERKGATAAGTVEASTRWRIGPATGGRYGSSSKNGGKCVKRCGGLVRV
jgi:hypothetical protein